MSEREFLLVVHPGRVETPGAAHQVAQVLRAADISVRVLTEEQPSTGIEGARVVPETTDAGRGCEIVLALGGDGTFLRAAGFAHAAGIPILGINFGRVGFMTEVEIEQLESALAQVIAKDYRIESRMTLDIVVSVDDEIVARGWALNEASIENESRLGVLEVVLEVDGRPVSSFGCDGVLISTPTGSTAYAFSAGGPVVWPDLEALLVIPSNAHALFARPLVTSPASVIAVETHASGHEALVFLDGRRTLSLPRGGRVEARRGSSPIRWIRLDSAPFADRMVTKFQLPVTGWRGRRPD